MICTKLFRSAVLARTKRWLTAALIFSSWVFLVSCSGSRNSYETINPNETLKPAQTKLELPPDLIHSSNGNVVTQQQYTEQDVLPEVLGITTHNDGPKRWLEVEAPAEKVWPRLLEYWGTLGATLVVADSKTGIMETDWVKQAENEDGPSGKLGKSNLVVSILSNIIDQDTALDKYIVRIERSESSSTLVYLTHRGSKKIKIGSSTVATHPEWEWVETGEDPEKVKIVLQSITYSLNPENA